jgi:hypothetical protein
MGETEQMVRLSLPFMKELHNLPDVALNIDRKLMISEQIDLMLFP